MQICIILSRNSIKTVFQWNTSQNMCNKNMLNLKLLDPFYLYTFFLIT